MVYDDADLPLGKIRLRAAGSAGGHNGMKSIVAEMGTDQLPRLRFGIGRGVGADMAEFVLSDFSSQETPLVEPAMERAIEAIRCLWENGIARAMSLFNRDPAEEVSSKSVKFWP
jgi:PTH1 family peptidyl-tRNA hydrolase